MTQCQEAASRHACQLRATQVAHLFPAFRVHPSHLSLLRTSVTFLMQRVYLVLTPSPSAFHKQGERDKQNRSNGEARHASQPDLLSLRSRPKRQRAPGYSAGWQTPGVGHGLAPRTLVHTSTVLVPLAPTGPLPRWCGHSMAWLLLQEPDSFKATHGEENTQKEQSVRHLATLLLP